MDALLNARLFMENIKHADKEDAEIYENHDSTTEDTCSNLSPMYPPHMYPPHMYYPYMYPPHMLLQPEVTNTQHKRKISDISVDTEIQKLSDKLVEKDTKISKLSDELDRYKTKYKRECVLLDTLELKNKHLSSNLQFKNNYIYNLTHQLTLVSSSKNTLCISSYSKLPIKVCIYGRDCIKHNNNHMKHFTHTNDVIICNKDIKCKYGKSCINLRNGCPFMYH
jgi:hypothetical protein